VRGRARWLRLVRVDVGEAGGGHPVKQRDRDHVHERDAHDERNVNTPTGIQITRGTLTTITQIFDANGQVVSESNEQILQFELNKNHEGGTFHREYESVVTNPDGTTCTTNHSLVDAGGAIRHEVNDVVCTP